MTEKGNLNISLEKKLSLGNKNDENNMNNMNKTNKNKHKKHSNGVKIQPVGSQPLDNQSSDCNQKVQPERLGDWIWFAWNNLNFSFRKVWNRCKMARVDSDMQYTSMEVSTLSSWQPLIGFPFSGAASAPYSNVMQPSHSFKNNSHSQK